MKFNYEKPELEEVELLLEGSSFCATTGVDKNPDGDGTGDGWD